MKKVTIVSFIAVAVLLTGCIEDTVKEQVFDEEYAAERKAVMDKAAKAAVAANVARLNKAESSK
ncbi:MAG TPA: hypothetical protein EYH42_05185 [Sulfurovum sp.]|nr:hypothetical protein [Sulfurovum sp.]